MDELIERTRLAAKILRDIGGQSAMAATVEEAAAALEAAREDAERYRWLRDRMAAEEITDETYARRALRTVGPIAKRPADSDYCDELDAAIDQARGKGGCGEGVEGG